MPLVNFANLDFDQIKVSIKDYLRANSKFTDYDFEGSNLSSIIDILAYNTYITSYNANMVSNEVFLDSATLRENVVSLIQNIGYLPRSRRAARINVSFYVDTSGYSSQPQNIKLNRGLVATTTAFANESYTFISLDDIVKPVNRNRALFTNIELVEGTYITTNFTVDSYDPKQRFILPNSGIDTTTIKVTVKPSRNSNTSRTYHQTGAVTSCHGHYTTNQTLFEVNSESPIYWIQEIEGERYELIFGDGIFGKKLEAPSFIEVSYVVCNGADGNGVNSLTFNGTLTDGRSGGLSLTSGISLLNVTGGGSDGLSPSNRATAYANLSNDLVRDFDMTLKFDRLDSTSSVVDWEASTSYEYNTLIRYNNELYKTTKALTSGTTFSDDNLYKFKCDIKTSIKIPNNKINKMFKEYKFER